MSDDTTPPRRKRSGLYGRRRRDYCKDCGRQGTEAVSKYRDPAGAVSYLCPDHRSARLRQDNLTAIKNQKRDTP